MSTDTKSRKLLGRMVKIGIAISSVTRGLDARKLLGRLISIGVVIAAAGLGLEVLYSTNYYPRTDDAEVFANFIGIAPQVEGPITRLNVRDNQFVKQGELSFTAPTTIHEPTMPKCLQISLGLRRRWRARLLG